MVQLDIELDMEMPIDCFNCELHKSCIHNHREINKRPNNCPLKERLSAEWIRDSNKDDNCNEYHCSNCGVKLRLAFENIEQRMNKKYSLYCERCGAKMCIG